MSAMTNDGPLFKSMKKIQSKYKSLTVAEYTAKIQKCWLLSFLCQSKPVVQCEHFYFTKLTSADPEEFLVSKMRGFPYGENFLERFRIKPIAALARNIAARTRNYTKQMHCKKVKNFQIVNSELIKVGMFVPGCARGTDRSFWLCPVLVADKMQFKEFAFASGVAVFRGATQIKVVPEPSDEFKLKNPQYRGNA